MRARRAARAAGGPTAPVRAGPAWPAPADRLARATRPAPGRAPMRLPPSARTSRVPVLGARGSKEASRERLRREARAPRQWTTVGPGAPGHGLMCGICGVYEYAHSRSVDAEVVAA